MNKSLPSKRIIIYSLLAFFGLVATSRAQSDQESVYYKKFVEDASGSKINHTPPQATFTTYLNNDQSKILIENAPRWDGGATNLEGKGYFGIELGNFPSLTAGDTAYVRFTDNVLSQQGTISQEIGSIPWSDPDPFTALTLTEVNLPEPPQNVQLKKDEQGDLTVSWTAQTGMIYRVYRRRLQDTIFTGESRMLYTLVASDLNTGSFTDSSVEADMNYAYIVYAENSEGISSSHSAEVVQGGKVKGLTANTTATNVELSWDPYKTEVGETAGYNIYRYSKDSGTGTWDSQNVTEKVFYSGSDTSYVDTRLLPGNEYRYRVEARNTNYKTFGLSDTLLVTTENSQDGYYTYASIKVAVVIFKNTPSGTVSDSKIEDIKRQLEVSREFYWRNSGMKFNVDLDYYVFDEKVSPSDDFATGLLSQKLKERGIMNTQYDMVYRYWARQTGYWSIGTGLTLQLPGPKRGTMFSQSQLPCGTGVVYPGNPDLNYCSSWVFIHEGQHAIDDLYRVNDHPEMAHGDHPWMFDVPKGNHLDFQATVFRTFKAYESLNEQWGDIYETTDADGDQMPDYDPRVPFNEQDFGSSTQSADTDNDGLSDREEALAGNYSGSDPNNPDDDGDGIKDGNDPFPRYDVNTTIKKLPTDMKISIDGDMSDWTEEAKVSHGVSWTAFGDNFEGDVYMTYDDNNLYVAMDMPSIAIPRFEWDFEADGKWHGAGNTQIEVNLSENRISKLRSWDARPEVQQFADDNPDDNIPGAGMWDNNQAYENEFQRRVVPPQAVDVSINIDDLPHIVMEMKIPRNESAGLNLTPGDSLGVNFYYGKVNNKPGNWATTFDQYSFVHFFFSDQTLTATEKEPAIAHKFELKQNYPNPFNPTTNISYSLAKAGKVRLTVYDMLGRKVATLLDHKQSAGRHHVSFDASKLSSGLYIYRLESGSRSQTRKMMLLK